MRFVSFEVCRNGIWCLYLWDDLCEEIKIKLKFFLGDVAGKAGINQLVVCLNTQKTNSLSTLCLEVNGSGGQLVIQGCRLDVGDIDSEIDDVLKRDASVRIDREIARG